MHHPYFATQISTYMYMYNTSTHFPHRSNFWCHYQYHTLHIEVKQREIRTIKVRISYMYGWGNKLILTINRETVKFYPLQWFIVEQFMLQNIIFRQYLTLTICWCPSGRTKSCNTSFSTYFRFVAADISEIFHKCSRTGKYGSMRLHVY